MSALFDYEATVRAILGFAAAHPTAFVWIVGVLLACLIADAAFGARNLIRRWRGAR